MHGIAVDYRATYINRIGNGRVPLIVLHWAALIPSFEYMALAKIITTERSPFAAICRALG